MPGAWHHDGSGGDGHRTRRELQGPLARNAVRGCYGGAGSAYPPGIGCAQPVYSPGFVCAWSVCCMRYGCARPVCPPGFGCAGPVYRMRYGCARPRVPSGFVCAWSVYRMRYGCARPVADRGECRAGHTDPVPGPPWDCHVPAWPRYSVAPKILYNIRTMHPWCS